MRSVRLLVAFVLLLCWCQAVISQYTTFVSTKGNDQWSGSLPYPTSNNTDGPFKTIQRAQQYVRQLRSKEGKFKQAVTISILPGIFPISQTVLFSPEDSGDEHAPVIYTKYSKEQGSVIISSCVPVSNWTTFQRGSDTLLRTVVEPVKSGKIYFTSLFMNNARRARARGPLRRYVKPVPNSRTQFVFAGTDLRQYDNLQDANVVMYHSWTASRHYIQEVNTQNSTVTFSNPAHYAIGTFGWQSQNRFYVENVYEELDQQGEWYLNRKTGELTYWPYQGETPDTIAACYPTQLELVKMVGDFDAGKFVENIVFQNIGFHHSDWYLDRTGDSDFQSASWMNTSAIFMRDTRNIEFSGVDVQHVGYNGIQAERGCTNIKIHNSIVNDMGTGGIRIGELTNTKYTTGHISVVNCSITDGGNVFKEGIGVLIHRTSDNLISGNEISYFFYTGVSVGWSWGYAVSNAYRNIIENNHISNIGKYELTDMGGIYTLGISNGTIIRNNRIHDVHSFQVLSWGIYLDEGTSNVLVENNHVTHTGSAGFFQHYGQNNIVRNNYFALADAEDGSIAIGDAEAHLSFSFINNTVVHTTQGRPLIFQRSSGQTLTRDQFVFDNNIYYNCVSFDPITVSVNVPKTQVMKFTTWQEVFGQDKSSVVINKCPL